jgi:hypothetical protein
VLSREDMNWLFPSLRKKVKLVSVINEVVPASSPVAASLLSSNILYTKWIYLGRLSSTTDEFISAISITTVIY